MAISDRNRARKRRQYWKWSNQLIRRAFEELESRTMLTSGISDLLPATVNAIIDRPFDGRVATFRAEGAFPTDFAAVIRWSQEEEPESQSPAMIKQEGDLFVVYAMHTWTDEGTPFTVTIYDIDNNDLVEYPPLSVAPIVRNGTEPFEKTTIRPLSLNLEAVEGQTFNDTVFEFLDTNLSRSASDYTVTLSGGESSEAIVTEITDGHFTVRPATPWTFYAESATSISVMIEVGAYPDIESVTASSSMLVRGSDLLGQGVTIPTPYEEFFNINTGQMEIRPTLTVPGVVATFTDANPYSTSQDFFATVNWGDGTPSAPNPNNLISITQSGPGEFSVTASHGYVHAGAYSITVRIYEGNHSRTSATSTVTVEEPPFDLQWWEDALTCHGFESVGSFNPLPSTVTDKTVRTTGTTVRGYAGQPISGLIGSFSADPDDYEATIDWGDGSPPEQQSVSVGGINGTHTYAKPGSYAISVSVIAEEQFEYLTDLNVYWSGVYCQLYDRSFGGSFTTGVTILDPHIELTTQSINAVQGAAVNASQLFTATGLLSDAVAIIEWGDGDVSLVEFDLSGAPQGAESVHVYTDPGNYTARIVARQGEEASFGTASVTIDPTEPYVRPLIPLEVGFEVWQSENVEGKIIARLKDFNPAHIGGLHEVEIDWGDGTKSIGSISKDPQGTIESDGRMVTYVIQAPHIYQDAGAYHLQLRYRDQLDEITMHGTALVKAGGILATANNVITTRGNARPDTVLATIQMNDPFATAEHFRAIVDWGNGNRGIAEIRGTGGLFHVYGSAVGFADLGNYTATVFIEDGRNTGQTVVVLPQILVGEAMAGSSDYVLGGQFEIKTPQPPDGPEDDEIKIGWGDGTVDTVLQAQTVHGPPQWTINSLPDVGSIHEYESDSGSTGWPPLTLTSYVYGIDFQRSIVVADGSLDVTNTRSSFIAHEDTSMPWKRLLLFTKSEFAESASAQIDWGDGKQSTAGANLNSDNTLSVLLNHEYDEEGTYPVRVTLESNGGNSRVITTTAIVINRDLALNMHPVGAVKEISTGEALVATIPADDWHPPWDEPGLTQQEIDEIREEFRPSDYFLGSIDWGDESISSAIFRVSSVDDELEIYGVHTYASPGEFTLTLKLEDLSPVSIQATTDVVVIEHWTHETLHRTNGFGEGYVDAIGLAGAILNTGGLVISHELDLDISPGTSVGGSPRLVYNSNTAHVRPILESKVSSSESQPVPTDVDVRLFWHDRDPQDWRPFSIDPLNHPSAPTNDYIVGDQTIFLMPIEQSGLFPWRSQIRLQIPGVAPPVYMEDKDVAEVVVRDKGDLDPGDAFDNEPFFGAGWGIEGPEHRLVFHKEGDLLWITGSGFSRRYTLQGDGTYKPEDTDFGELVKQTREIQVLNALGNLVNKTVPMFVYTAADQTKYTFNHLGFIEEIDTPSEPPMKFEYDAEAQLIKVIAPDLANVTLDYTNLRLVTVHETGGRDVQFANGSTLSQITDADGSTRSFGYDGNKKLNSDSWGIQQTTYTHDGTTELLTTVNRGLGSVYEVKPQNANALKTPIIKYEDHSSHVIDPLDRDRNREFDITGNILHEDGPDGTSLSGSYDRDWERNPLHKKVMDYVGPEGHQILTYDSKAYLENVYRTCLAVCDPPSKDIHTNRHPTFHALASFKDEDLKETQFARDPLTNVVTEITDAAQNNTVNEYNAAVLLTKTTDRRGKSTTYEYDGNRRLIAETDALGNRTTRTYDAVGNLSTVTNARSYTTTYEYDAKNRLHKVTDALTKDVVTDYDASGLVTSQTNQNGAVTQYYYDQRGYQTSVTEAVGTPVQRSTGKEYDLVGNLTRQVDPMGHPTLFAYDTLDRRTLTTDALNGLWKTKYDYRGNVTEEIDAEGHSTTHQYNWDNQRTATTNHLGHSTLYEYTAAGDLTKVTDALGRNTKYEYDDLHRRTKTIDAKEGAFQTKYDEEGNVTEHIDQKGNSTQYFYDDVNRRTLQINALDGTRGFNYDSVGNLTAEFNERGYATSYLYDPLNRKTQEINAYGVAKEFTYDGVGNLKTEKDERTFTTTFEYDKLNRLVSRKNPLNDTFYWYYNADDQLTQETNERGKSTHYAYDELHRRTQITDALSGIESFEYDAVGNLTSQTNPRGFTTTHAYDEINRRLVTRDPLLGATFFAYDEVDNQTWHVNELGRITVFEYDELNRRTAQVNAANDRRTWSYDPVGNLTAETDERTNLTAYGYDELNRRTKVTDAAQGQTDFLYDAVGNVTRETNPRRFSTDYAYDALSRRTMTTDAQCAYELLKYDPVGNVTEVTDKRGFITESFYDELRRLTKTIDALDGIHKFAYDQVGNVTSTTDPLTRTTAYGYDALDRRTRVTTPLGHSTVTGYDANGNVTSVTDPLNHSTTYAYDPLDRQTTATDALGGSTTYGYNAVDSRTLLRDPVNNSTTWEYDLLSRVTRETNQLTKSREFAYDKVGNVTARTDRRGKVTTYTYDSLNRLKTETWVNSGLPSAAVTLDYNANGGLTEAVGTDASYVFSYDSVDRVDSSNQDIEALGGAIQMSQIFDPVGNRKELNSTIFSNKYDYDDLGRVKQIKQLAGSNPAYNVTAKQIDLVYDAASQFDWITRIVNTDAATRTIYGFDADSRLTDLTHKGANSGAGLTAVLADYDFAYDDANRLTNVTSLVDGLAVHTYDVTDQLKVSTYTGGSNPNEAYDYDANGNRDSTGYVTGDNNLTTADGTYTYEYDDEGNRTKRTTIATGEVTDYEWDYRNRLTKIVEKDSAAVITKSVTYQYDPFNRRVSKLITPYVSGVAQTSTSEIYVYDAAREAVDGLQHIAAVFRDTDGPAGPNTPELHSLLLHGPSVDQILAEEQFTPGGTPSSTVQWPLGDHLGTIRDIAIFDSTTGVTAVANHLTYSSFGQILTETDAAIDSLFGFTGRERDEESGLHYYRARYYDPQLGQFIGEDPTGFDAGDDNLRRYVGNNGINLSDPSGLDEVDPLESAERVVANLQNGRLARRVNQRDFEFSGGTQSQAVLALLLGGRAAEVRSKILGLEYDLSWGSGDLRYLPGDFLTFIITMDDRARQRVKDWRHDLARSKDELAKIEQLYSELGLNAIEVRASPNIDGMMSKQSGKGLGIGMHTVETVAAFMGLGEQGLTPTYDEFAFALGAASVARVAAAHGVKAASREAVLEVADNIVSEVTVVSPRNIFDLAVAPSGTPSPWTNRFPGVQVRQYGDFWVKRVNPDSNPLLVRWGRLTIERQAAGLERLRSAGRPAANSRLFESGRVVVEDVGTPLGYRAYVTPSYWRARYHDSRALGTFINDLRPGNYGAGYRAFDPALDPLQATIGIGAGIGVAYGIYEFTDED